MRGPTLIEIEKARRAVQGYALARLHVGPDERVFLPEVLADPGEISDREERPQGYGSASRWRAPEMGHVAAGHAGNAKGGSELMTADRRGRRRPPDSRSA